MMIGRTATAEFIDELIENYQVVIFSKSYCPFCNPTKNLFKSMPSVQVKIVELDREVEGSPMQQALQAKTGQRTVPNVFVNNHHIGGNDDVQKAHKDGTLLELLNEPPHASVSGGSMQSSTDSDNKDMFLLNKLRISFNMKTRNKK